MRRFFFGSLPISVGVALLSFAFVVQPVLAGCFGSNNGAAYSYDHYFTAARSVEDFVPATVQPGRAVVHPLQLISPTGVDFIGWGTAKGIGTSDSGAISNCPDDYNGWNVYVDGVSFTRYFCRQQYGSVGSTALDQEFKFSYGGTSCGDPNFDKWRFYLNGDLKSCQRINTDEGDIIAVGGEAIGSGSQLIDIHFGALEWKSSATGNWYNWGSGSRCEDTGYRIRKHSDYNVHAEKIP